MKHPKNPLPKHEMELLHNVVANQDQWKEQDNLPRCDCGHLFEICNYPRCPLGPTE